LTGTNDAPHNKTPASVDSRASSGLKNITGPVAPDAAAQAITEGAMLGLYTFRKHQTKEAEEVDVEQLLIVSKDSKGLAVSERR
jgi:hypothetical protein